MVKEDLDDYKVINYIKRIPSLGEYSKWSFSKWSMYQGCSRRYKYIHIDKVKLPPEDHTPFIKGRFIHFLIESEFTKILNRPRINDNNLLNDLQKVDTSHMLLWRSICNGFFNTDTYNSIKELVINSTRCELEFRINYHKLLSGAIDFFVVVGSTLYIKDWKTGKAKDLNYNQLKLYAFIMIELLHSEGVNIEYVNIEYIFVENTDYKRSVELPLNEFLSSNKPFLEGIKSLIDTIGSDTEWDRTSNTDECTFCKVKQNCESDKKSETNDFIKEMLS